MARREIGGQEKTQRAGHRNPPLAHRNPGLNYSNFNFNII